MRHRFWRPLLATLLSLSAGVAHAQAFPTRPVKIVVPFAPGGNLDVTARLVGGALARELGQSVVVENKPGAGGTVGCDFVAKSAPDGYTLVASTSATTIVSPMLIPNPPYTLASFAPVGVMAVTPLVVEVAANNPIADLKGLLAKARAHPGTVTVGHSGNGTTNHIAILQLQTAAGVSFNPIPYKGSGPAIVDLMGGQIDAATDQTSGSLPHIRNGKLKAVAVTGANRVSDLPNVRTLAEQGVNVEIVSPSVLLAPAHTPPEVLRTLNAALARALADPAVVKRLAELGGEVRPMPVEAVDAFLRGEETQMKALAASGLLKAE